MVWFWGKIALRGASRQSGQEQLGYFNLSFHVLIDALQARLSEQGVEARAGCPVQEVRPLQSGRVCVRLDNEEREFDQAVMALHNRDFLRLVPALPDSYRQQLGRIQYEAGSCLLLSL